jgi:hypothetical protein
LVTWAVLLERLVGSLDDTPTRLAVTGLVGCLAASAALLWWASQHYAARRVRGGRWTTWEKAMQVKGSAAQQQEAPEIDREPMADQAGWQEVT